MKRILVTGKDGQIGWELQRTLAPLGEVQAFDRQQLDLLNPDQIIEVVREVKPDIIVNAAAYTAVDKAESEQHLAMSANAVAAGIFAEEAKRLHALLVHYSTDYVFDGNSTIPYLETDRPNPINEYGRSKWKGETAIQHVGGDYVILRTGWVYGLRGKNFLLTMLRIAKEREELKIVGDQLGSPTWSRLIAEATAALISKKGSEGENKGIYHLTSHGQTSWFHFADAIFDIASNMPAGAFGITKWPKRNSISTSEYPTPAQRPKYSVLSNDKIDRAFNIKMPHWKKALELCLLEN